MCTFSWKNLKNRITFFLFKNSFWTVIISKKKSTNLTFFIEFPKQDVKKMVNGFFRSEVHSIAVTENDGRFPLEPIFACTTCNRAACNCRPKLLTQTLFTRHDQPKTNTGNLLGTSFFPKNDRTRPDGANDDAGLFVVKCLYN